MCGVTWAGRAPAPSPAARSATRAGPATPSTAASAPVRIIGGEICCRILETDSRYWKLSSLSYDRQTFIATFSVII